MKKTLTLAAAAVLTLSGLAGCSKSTRNSMTPEPSSASTEEKAAANSTTKDFSSTATCTLADGSKNTVVADVNLEGKDGKYTATFNFVEAGASAASYAEDSVTGQVVLVGDGATTSATITSMYAEGEAVDLEVPGLSSTFEGGKLTIVQEFNEEAVTPVRLPMTWFAELTVGQDKVAQCGVFGDSVEVK